MNSYNLNHLKELEAESIFVLREVAAQFERPALLFSGGKDSLVVFHLAKKAFFELIIKKKSGTDNGLSLFQRYHGGFVSLKDSDG
jgi:3'-phosphoadenosine 5'-phosphosulfate sulfotransferase (PAPS reductase)/FAD synthetase